MEQQTKGSRVEYAAYVGLDWGDREHAWALQWADSGRYESGRIEQTPEALDAWICQWASRLNGRRIAIAVEQKHGAVVWMLLKYECVQIFPIHPQTAAIPASAVSVWQQKRPDRCGPATGVARPSSETSPASGSGG